ncbi:hypothetical protein P8452_14659 [Trifolium repens]|nr:hypothetical protein P8452_14659 [Trifolium repens]
MEWNEEEQPVGEAAGLLGSFETRTFETIIDPSQGNGEEVTQPVSAVKEKKMKKQRQLFLNFRRQSKTLVRVQTKLLSLCLVKKSLIEFVVMEEQLHHQC